MYKKYYNTHVHQTIKRILFSIGADMRQEYDRIPYILKTCLSYHIIQEEKIEKTRLTRAALSALSESVSASDNKTASSSRKRHSSAESNTTNNSTYSLRKRQSMSQTYSSESSVPLR